MRLDHAKEIDYRNMGLYNLYLILGHVFLQRLVQEINLINKSMQLNSSLYVNLNIT